MEPGWIDKKPASEGLRMYFDVVRARLPLVVLAVVIAVGAAVLLVSRAEKVYQAEAGLLVTPVPRTNTSLYGLGLVSESGDPTRDAETLAKLITTPAIAERVRRQLGLDNSSNELLSAVTALPVAQSSIVAITAEANDPELAARIANAFGEAAVAIRTQRMQALLDDVIPRLRQQLAGVPSSEVRAREELSSRIRDLEALRLLPDPTLHLETRAAPASSPVAPRPLVSVAAALIAGLILGIGIVLTAHVFDTRVEREEDLRRYQVPVVGRIPRERLWRRIGRRGPLPPSQLSAITLDAYRRLASALISRAEGGEPTLFITSAGPGDGKTTTSVNLSSALASLDEDVILADADVRRPSLARFLAVPPTVGLTDVVSGRVSLSEALVTAHQLPQGVRVLAQPPLDGSIPTPIAPEAADRLVFEARLRAKWLIFDGPALNYAPDALPLAKRDALFVVIRLRRTRLRDLADLADLLVQQGLTPDGFIVIGSKARPVYY